MAMICDRCEAKAGGAVSVRPYTAGMFMTSELRTAGDTFFSADLCGPCAERIKAASDDAIDQAMKRNQPEVTPRVPG